MTRTASRLALLSTVLAFTCGSLITARAQTDPSSMISKGVRSIAITATDRVTRQADVATVHIGFELFGPDQPTALATASTASNAIMDALRSAGIPADTIESEQQSIAPMDSFQLNQLPASERASRAFVAQQGWIVRTSADAAARVLDIAMKAGANRSGSIDWSLKDPNAASAEAAGKALQRARSQAEAMSKGLGVQLGQLLFASNQVESSPIRPVAMMAMAKADSNGALRPLAINPRQIETSATVYAVFAIQ